MASKAVEGQRAAAGHELSEGRGTLDGGRDLGGVAAGVEARPGQLAVGRRVVVLHRVEFAAPVNEESKVLDLRGRPASR